jgi:hypothetical protein
MNIRVETTKDGQTKFWDVPEYCLLDRGLYDDEMQELHEYLSDCDIGIDSGGSFTSQVDAVIMDFVYRIKSGQVQLVLADSDHYNMSIDIIAEA